MGINCETIWVEMFKTARYIVRINIARECIKCCITGGNKMVETNALIP